MSWLLFNVPTDTDEPLDSRDDSFDEAAPGNQYLTKKDLKVILLGLALVALIFWPIYLKMRRDRDRYACGLNVHAISIAMQAYADSNDEHFPPTFIPAADASLPRSDEKGRPYTWASTLANIVGMDSDRNFACPSASHEEGVVSEGVNGADLISDYGMYIAESAASREGSSSAGSTILIAESANDGANDTFDPAKLPAESDGSVRDGFMIAWQKSNFEAPPADSIQGSTITRLAFKNTPNGLSRKSDEGRHDDAIYVIFADGHYALVKANRLLGSQMWQPPAP